MLLWFVAVPLVSMLVRLQQSWLKPCKLHPLRHLIAALLGPAVAVQVRRKWSWREGSVTAEEVGGCQWKARWVGGGRVDGQAVLQVCYMA